MEQLFWGLDEAFAQLGRALVFLILPPWLPLVVVWLRNSERYLVFWAAALGILGAILAHLIVPDIYFWSGHLADLGLVGVPAAALSGLIYGGGLGLLVSGFIRALRLLGSRASLPLTG